MRTKTVVVLAVLVFTARMALASPAEGSFERTLEVSGPVEIEVNTGSGRIQVRAGKAGSVHIVGSIRARGDWFPGSRTAEEKIRAIEANPPIEQNGNVFRIGHFRDESWQRNISISYELEVPVETRLQSRTGSGSQFIEGIAGPLEAASGSGSLQIGHIGAEVQGSTGSGSIQLDSVKGGARARAGSGSIRASAVEGNLSISTGSGSVELQEIAGNVEVETGSGGVDAGGLRGSLRVRTGSGSITAEGEPTGEWHLHSSSGGVRVRLPRETGFDLQARTSSGAIHTDHPITVQGTLSRRELQGKVRGGGFLVQLSTSSGSIRIE